MNGQIQQGIEIEIIVQNDKLILKIINENFRCLLLLFFFLNVLQIDWGLNINKNLFDGTPLRASNEFSIMLIS